MGIGIAVQNHKGRWLLGLAKGLIPLAVFALLTAFVWLMADGVTDAYADLCGDRSDCPSLEPYLGMLRIMGLAGALGITGVVLWAMTLAEQKHRKKEQENIPRALSN